MKTTYLQLENIRNPGKKFGIYKCFGCKARRHCDI